MATNIQQSLHVGPAGWHYEDWDGVVYPFPRPRRFDALAYVASYFNLIEINSTFYHVPAPAQCLRWVERVRERNDFQFTVKAHQSLTHRRELSPAEVAPFIRAVEPIAAAGRLGAVLLQFPWSFRFDDDARRRLDARLAALRVFPLAVEVRHASWCSPAADDYFADRNVTVCGIDQPVIGESMAPFRHRVGPAGAYFRFHGRNYREWFARDAGRDARYNYFYSDDELKPWVDVVRESAASGVPAFVVLNNHFRGQAPANAFVVNAMLLGRPVPAPRPLRDEYPAIQPWTTPGPDTQPPPEPLLFGD